VTDPFDDLYEPIRPADPDPVFARRLRARLERALALPKGVIPVSAATTADARPATRPGGQAMPRPAAVPYLAVSDARAAIDWYAEIFGARLAGEPIEMPDGRIGHCDLEISGGHLYLADEHPEIGVTAPRPGESPVSLMLPVQDADAVRERAMAAGATADRPPYDAYGQRNAWIIDPFGHRWGLSSPLPAHRPTCGAARLLAECLWLHQPQRSGASPRAETQETVAGDRVPVSSWSCCTGRCGRSRSGRRRSRSSRWPSGSCRSSRR